ncbi:hypothetical protein M3J09_002697 [Ascochyta lentis]
MSRVQGVGCDIWVESRDALHLKIPLRSSDFFWKHSTTNSHSLHDDSRQATVSQYADHASYSALYQSNQAHR